MMEFSSLLRNASEYLSNHIVIFRVGAEMDVMFVDLLKENPSNDPPIDSNG